MRSCANVGMVLMHVRFALGHEWCVNVMIDAKHVRYYDQGISWLLDTCVPAIYDKKERKKAIKYIYMYVKMPRCSTKHSARYYYGW